MDKVPDRSGRFPGQRRRSLRPRRVGQQRHEAFAVPIGREADPFAVDDLLNDAGQAVLEIVHVDLRTQSGTPKIMN